MSGSHPPTSADIRVGAMGCGSSTPAEPAETRKVEHQRQPPQQQTVQAAITPEPSPVAKEAPAKPVGCPAAIALRYHHLRRTNPYPRKPLGFPGIQACENKRRNKGQGGPLTLIAQNRNRNRLAHGPREKKALGDPASRRRSDCLPLLLLSVGSNSARASRWSG